MPIYLKWLLNTDGERVRQDELRAAMKGVTTRDGLDQTLSARRWRFVACPGLPDLYLAAELTLAIDLT